VLAFLLVSSAAHAQKRVALVIGNSAYKHTAKLANPRHDAEDVSAVLKNRGFEVLVGLDLDKAALDRKVREFADVLQGAKVGVFFYGGHGLQVGGQNYLVPVDAELSTVSALDFEMVRLELVHRTMEREAQTNIVFLDACRDNPLARNLARAMGTRSVEVGRGLAPVESGIGTLISFSTQPGNVALDGTGRNSPFAGALVKHISTSTDDLSAILISVRNEVIKETHGKQVPWEHSSLTGRFYFAAATQTLPSRPTAQLQSSPAVDLFTPEEFARLSQVAARKKIPIQPFQIYRPAADVPDELRRFVGVWISDTGFEKTGRQIMLILSDIDRIGRVTGYQGIGPPTAKSTTRTPAIFSPFVGTISGRRLEFTTSIQRTIATFDTRYRIDLTENFKNGIVSRVGLKPAWTLVDAEQSAKP
jgi:hypothetical protein